jgi:signal peptidase I
MNAKRLRVKARQWWRKEIRPLLILAVVLFSIRSSLADWNDVPSGSMNPTIVEGDRIFVNKLAYDLKVPFTTWHLAEWGDPQRGDIVVFYSPHDGTRLVKRVIGLPGDLVEMRDDHLYINGEPLDYAPLSADIASALSANLRENSLFASEKLPSHPHAMMATPALPAKRTFDAVRIADGHYFMMGDNRDNSFDSRYFGTVERKRIVGRATSVVMSFDKSHYWRPRTERFFSPLDRAEPASGL